MVAIPFGFNNLGANLNCLTLLRDQMHSLHEKVANAEADASMSSEQRKCDAKSCDLQLLCIRQLRCAELCRLRRLQMQPPGKK